MSSPSTRELLFSNWMMPDRGAVKQRLLKGFLQTLKATSPYEATVDAEGTGQFRTIQEAIDAIAPLVSPTQKGRIDIAPGEYVENVVLPRNIVLNAIGGFGPSRIVVIRSTSGDTLTVPAWDVLLQGISVFTDSIVPTDAAVRMADDGLPPGVDPAFALNFYMSATGVGRAYRGDPIPGGGQFIAIYGGTDSFGGAPQNVFIDGSVFIWFLGGGGGNCATSLRIEGGGQALVGNGVGISADPVAGLVVDCDGGFFAGLDVRFDDGFNGIRGRNGSTVFLLNTYCLSGLGGTPVDMDPTSFLVTGNVQLDPIGSPPLANWIVLGPWIQVYNTKQGAGRTLPGSGAEERPVAAPPGYRFFAVDLNAAGAPAGSGVWLTRGQDLAWRTPTDVVVP